MREMKRTLVLIFLEKVNNVPSILPILFPKYRIFYQLLMVFCFHDSNNFFQRLAPLYFMNSFLRYAFVLPSQLLFMYAKTLELQLTDFSKEGIK
jgi:hypothetical protein